MIDDPRIISPPTSPDFGPKDNQVCKPVLIKNLRITKHHLRCHIVDYFLISLGLLSPTAGLDIALVSAGSSCMGILNYIYIFSMVPRQIVRYINLMLRLIGMMVPSCWSFLSRKLHGSLIEWVARLCFPIFQCNSFQPKQTLTNPHQPETIHLCVYNIILIYIYNVYDLYM